MHFSRDEGELQAAVTEAMACWNDHPQLKNFASYFHTEWIASRFCRWQCFHTPQGHAKTNNPLEQFNRAIKRDYTNNKLLAINVLADQLMRLSRARSVAGDSFATAAVVSADMLRRYRYVKRNNLVEVRSATPSQSNRVSISFLLNGSPVESAASSTSSTSSLRVFQKSLDNPASPMSKADDKQRHIFYFEVFEQPSLGWLVDTDAKVCGCRYWFKYACCVHLLLALDHRQIAFPGKPQPEPNAKFVCRRKRRKTNKDSEAAILRQPPGRIPQVGPALAMV